MIRLSFNGGAGTVTGSKHRFLVNGDEFLVDCGMFQGLKELRLRNWAEPAFDPRRLKWVLLTHAHIDHCGWIPRLVRHGFKGQIYCTGGTRDLAEIILMDSAHLQGEEAEFRNQRGLSSHAPAEPLYTPEDVQAALSLFRTVEYESWVKLSPAVSFRMIDAGHILGSGFIELRLTDGARELRAVASGDVGRYNMPLTPDPEGLPPCDVLLLESTYGDREHESENPEDQLEGVVKRILETKGILVIPSFAVGRAQQLMFILHQLTAAGRIPRLPVFLDTPMGIDATNLYVKYAGHYRVDEEALRNGVVTLFSSDVRMIRTAAESMKLEKLKGPAILISSSGMVTGGRVLHHLRNFLPDPKNVVALVGYQAAGTRGRYLAEGAKTLKILRENVPVKAFVADLKGFSGHADANELMRWADGIKPKRCFLVHGEPEAAAALAARLRSEKGWDAVVARLDQTVDL